MTFQPRYRQIIAAILLIVYAFIATPVLLWHHHPVTGEKHHAIYSDKDEVSQSHGVFSEAGCAVCAHKYAAYHGDIFIPTLSPAIVYSPLENGCYAATHLSSSCFLFSNKSPPALS
ncbi:MAG: hypothetical protein KF746_16790 [Chitinophagaceae bacterium]|nr:hypothetical protein [Chitinophagaceae bacterium]